MSDIFQTLDPAIHHRSPSLCVCVSLSHLISYFGLNHPSHSYSFTPSWSQAYGHAAASSFDGSHGFASVPPLISSIPPPPILSTPTPYAPFVYYPYPIMKTVPTTGAVCGQTAFSTQHSSNGSQKTSKDFPLQRPTAKFRAAGFQQEDHLKDDITEPSSPAELRSF